MVYRGQEQTDESTADTRHKTEVSETRRQIGPGNGDDAVDLGLQAACEAFKIFVDKRGIGADRLQRA
jgi:hypothetical protein